MPQWPSSTSLRLPALSHSSCHYTCWQHHAERYTLGEGCHCTKDSVQSHLGCFDSESGEGNEKAGSAHRSVHRQEEELDALEGSSRGGEEAVTGSCHSCVHEGGGDTRSAGDDGSEGFRS